tara:strand:+ start:338 stop:502 length:165 start_codon:yes stop_codon:yes gene_type:complete
MANLKINDFILMIDDLAEVLLERDSVELGVDYTEEAEAILRKIGGLSNGKSKDQ